LKRVLRLYNTVKYLKPIQVFYQLWYRILKYFSYSVHQKQIPLKLVSTDFFAYPFILPTARYFHPNKFVFLNLSKQFGQTINWNESEYGKLWNYNLQYLDYLNQQNIDQQTTLVLIHSLYKEIHTGRIPNEPYPASLRILNLIKFIHRTNEKNTLVLSFLNNQISYLSKNKEYHILGNHLLENAFALTAAGLVSQDHKLFKESSQLLLSELNEQILPDGAHFERSVMYHAILFERLLDLINLFLKNEFDQSSKINLVLKQKAENMLGFIQKICFSNLDMPMFNDASNGISSSIPELIQYAATLGIQTKPIQLKESGYRKLESNNFEIVIDVEGIAPNYQPGHAHADSTSFICYINQKPFLVETGTSTYQAGKRRAIERASSSHNVVVINQINSADVWGAFRVGKRPNVKLLKEENNEIVLSHDAYSNQGITYLKRSFSLHQELSITDEVKAIKNINSCIAYFHFHPTISAIVNENECSIDTEIAKLYFKGAKEIKLSNYEFAEAFNVTKTALKAEVHFDTILHTTIVKKHD
jgi:uncharacterized heparinase superfamily protein